MLRLVRGNGKTGIPLHVEMDFERGERKLEMFIGWLVVVGGGGGSQCS